MTVRQDRDEAQQGPSPSPIPLTPLPQPPNPVENDHDEKEAYPHNNNHAYRRPNDHYDYPHHPDKYGDCDHSTGVLTPTNLYEFINLPRHGGNNTNGIGDPHAPFHNLPKNRYGSTCSHGTHPNSHFKFSPTKS